MQRLDQCWHSRKTAAEPLPEVDPRRGLRWTAWDIHSQARLDAAQGVLSTSPSSDTHGPTPSLRKRAPDEQPAHLRPTPLIAHLKGREKRLEAIGWTGRPVCPLGMRRHGEGGQRPRPRTAPEHGPVGVRKRRRSLAGPASPARSDRLRRPGVPSSKPGARGADCHIGGEERRARRNPDGKNSV